MVAHVSEFSGSFRRSSCDVRVQAAEDGWVARRPSAISSAPVGRDVRGRSARGHLRLVVDNGPNQRTQPDWPLPSVGGTALSVRHTIEERLNAGLRQIGLPGGVTVAAVTVAVVLVGLLVTVRVSQGVPPADFVVNDGSAMSSGVASPGDMVVVAGEGDSLWSLAGEYASDLDRRTAVAALVEANGGAAIVVGQAIVIPGELLA